MFDRTGQSEGTGRGIICGITEKQTGIGAEANDLVGSPGLLKGMYYESVCFARDY